MKPSPLLLLLAAPVLAQDIFTQGEQVFQKTCAQGYCHGSGGTQGRAPKLIGRNFDTAVVTKVVREGVPNTGMPGFERSLPNDQLQAVIAYVLRISGADVSKMPNAAAAVAAGAPVRPMSAGVRRGKDLFFDAVRGEKRCGTCHALEGWGIPIGPNLAAGGPYDAAALRSGKKSSIKTATAGRDSFPAVVVEQSKEQVRIYDLTVLPPVLRTFVPAEIRLSDGSSWTHAGVTGAYTDADLGAIAMYLGWMAR
ncbi:MAG: c-type cytochrome [Bryobacteraceae bacterium]